MPAVNQVEMSPFLYQKDLLEHCQARDVLVTAFSPLVRGQVLGDPVLADIGKKNCKTPAQVILRWCLQKGMAAIPRSADLGHIRQNSQVFDFSLDEQDMARLDLLHSGLRTTTIDPDTYE
jgi:diketogulonate reductase-like aldo/keto reductase